MLVEVIGTGDAQTDMGERLAAQGIPCRPRGKLIEINAPGRSDLHDLIRDTAVDAGVGLVRLAADHRHIEDVFREEAGHGAPS